MFQTFPNRQPGYYGFQSNKHHWGETHIPSNPCQFRPSSSTARPVHAAGRVKVQPATGGSLGSADIDVENHVFFRKMIYKWWVNPNLRYSLHGKPAVSVIVSPRLYETHLIVWSKLCDFILNFLPWFPVFFCELGKGSINTVLLVKIEGPVWYTIYHLPIVKGVSSNPSIHQPTNGKRTSMGSIHAVKLTRSPKGLIGQGDLGLRHPGIIRTLLWFITNQNHNPEK